MTYPWPSRGSVWGWPSKVEPYQGSVLWILQQTYRLKRLLWQPQDPDLEQCYWLSRWKLLSLLPHCFDQTRDLSLRRGPSWSCLTLASVSGTGFLVLFLISSWKKDHFLWWIRKQNTFLISSGCIAETLKHICILEENIFLKSLKRSIEDGFLKKWIVNMKYWLHW
jgi:hypothetical protein